MKKILYFCPQYTSQIPEKKVSAEIPEKGGGEGEAR